jgi:CheY-like chemotaxis protein
MCPLAILLVDDNHVNIMVARKILSMLGYGKTEAVFDGQQAIDELARRTYDLVLMDLQMPVLDGYSANQRILELYGEPSAGGPCVIALSANVDQASPVTFSLMFWTD